MHSLAAHKFSTQHAGPYAVAMREFFKRLKTVSVPAVLVVSVARGDAWQGTACGRRARCDSARFRR